MKKLILTLAITLMSLMSFAQKVTFKLTGFEDITKTCVTYSDNVFVGELQVLHFKSSDELTVETFDNYNGNDFRVFNSNTNGDIVVNSVQGDYTGELQLSDGTYYLMYVYNDNGDFYPNYVKLIVGDATDFVQSVGVNDIAVEDIELLVYPNPVTDIVNVKFDSRVALPVELYTLSGQLLEMNTATFEGMNEVQLNMSDRTPGMYFVKVGNVTQKFVVE